MALSDPAEKALLRLEVRRYAGRCDNHHALMQRADSLRELSRLASLPIPYRISNELEARDLQFRLLQAAEDRTKEVISEQIMRYVKADPLLREGMKSKMAEEWSNLTGPLGHLRNWAKGRLAHAEQTLL